MHCMNNGENNNEMDGVEVIVQNYMMKKAQMKKACCEE